MRKSIASVFLVLSAYLSLAQGGRGFIMSIQGVPPIAYATWNPTYVISPYITLDATKLVVTVGSSVGAQVMLATIGEVTGKYYWEIYLTTYTSLKQIMIGVSAASPGTWVGNNITSWGVGAVFSTPYKVHNGGYTTYGLAFLQGDIISIACDFGGGTMNIYDNGTLVGTSPSWSGLSGTLYPAISNVSSDGFVATANFGQNAWDTRTATLRATLASSGYTIGLY